MVFCSASTIEPLITVVAFNISPDAPAADLARNLLVLIFLFQSQAIDVIPVKALNELVRPLDTDTAMHHILRHCPLGVC